MPKTTAEWDRLLNNYPADVHQTALAARGRILTAAPGVKLGLVGGATLADPEHLLTGSGKVHRYVLAESEAALKNPAVTALIKSAVAAWKSRQASRAR